MAIEKGDETAMNNLGHYYEKQGENEKAVKYYLMAIEKGDVYAMNNLGCYYKNQGENEKAVKHYLMAIEKGNASAMNNLGYYYGKQGENEKAVKYYLMAIEKGNKTALHNAIIYIEEHCDINFILQIKECTDSKDVTYKMNKLLVKFRKLELDYLSKLKKLMDPEECANVYKKKHKKCYMCDKNKKLLTLHCGHSMCYDCFTQTNVCNECGDLF